jgi:pyruvate dehydrogenase E2 component (dihydrolipoamide acetyltransferase)
MVQALRMPMMGNTMETGLLAEWHVEVGDSVAADQVVAVVESEKAAADVVANRVGTLARVDVEAGEEVPPGTLIGVVLGPEEDIADAPAPRSRFEPGGGGEDAATPPSPERPSEREPTGDAEPTGSSRPTTGALRAAPGARRLAEDAGVDLHAVEGTGPDGAVLIADVEAHLDADAGPSTGSGGGGRAFVPPSTRRLARELGVDLDAVAGTGTGGRVTESDVRGAAGLVDAREGTAPDGESVRRSRPEAGGIAGPPPRDPSRFGVTVAEERPLSGVRRTVAERMSRSAREAPQVTLDREVAVERAFETASELAAVSDGADESGVAVGFVDLLVGAAVHALERHPEFNAWYEGETLRLLEEVNVAVAVDGEAGLLTPVIREAGGRTLAGLARERRRLTDAVLEGRHGLDDLQGGTFTVSNLGPLGVDSFDPIIDPPQVAILGVGRVVEGACTLSLAFDHRVVDGADAARFLDTLAAGLESPSVVVAERTAAGTEREPGAAGVAESVNGVGPEADAGPVDAPSGAATTGSGSTVESAVAADLAERAREVAAAHDWPVPEFDVRLESGEDRPTVTVWYDGDGEALHATLRRLTYAACRESRYADAVVGLRDPHVEVVSPAEPTST